MRNCLQIGCLVLGILCFFYYIGITLYAGLRTSIAWVWPLGGAFFLFLWRALLYVQRHPGTPLRGVTGVLLLLTAAGFAVILVLGSRVASAMHAAPPKNLSHVIVLGAQVRGEQPSRALRRRLDCALAYAKENPETVLVLSGGKGPDEEISEAECMRRYLTQHGLEEERLLQEDRSESTEENLRFSDQLYDLKGASVGVLSNNFHVYRALRLAEGMGYQKAAGIAAPSDFGMLPHNILREICCLLLEKAKGNIF